MGFPLCNPVKKARLCPFSTYIHVIGELVLTNAHCNMVPFVSTLPECGGQFRNLPASDIIDGEHRLMAGVVFLETISLEKKMVVQKSPQLSYETQTDLTIGP